MRVLQVGLREAGLAVRVAASGPEAVAVYRQHVLSIGVVLLDVKMPGMDGLDVLSIRAGQVRAIASGLHDPIGLAIAPDGACLVAEAGAGRVVSIAGSGVDTVVDDLQRPQGILVLGQQLGENADGNLTHKQVEFARTIHGAGTDLLNLISDILDLSKIESGTVSVEAEEVFFSTLLEMVARPFRHEAENRKLAFEVHLDPRLPRSLVTDSKRLQQVLKNLLSNAFKFTEQGNVRLSVSTVEAGWDEGHPVLGEGTPAVAFEVSDTGIGIPYEKQRIIFEAFQQADAEALPFPDASFECCPLDLWRHVHTKAGAGRARTHPRLPPDG